MCLRVAIGATLVCLAATLTIAQSSTTLHSDAASTTEASSQLASMSAAAPPATTTASGTTAAPTPAPIVSLDASICALDPVSLRGLKIENRTETFLVSLSPCAAIPLRPNSNAAATPCGAGYATWTEAGDQFIDRCLYLYTRNYTTGDAFQSLYSNGTNWLRVSWVCTGIEGDTDAKDVSITDVAGSPANRSFTLRTKGCVRREGGDLKAGVVIAIVVVAVFVLVVIVSVVRAKCCGTAGGGAAGSAGARPPGVDASYQQA
jgi:hypothetical protein